jgi:hypothetical protein
MGNLAEIFAIACDECNGAGFIFFGNDLDYDVEPCDCALTPNHNHFNQTNE